MPAKDGHSSSNWADEVCYNVTKLIWCSDGCLEVFSCAVVRDRLDQWSYSGLKAAVATPATSRESFTAVQRHHPIAGEGWPGIISNKTYLRLCLKL